MTALAKHPNFRLGLKLSVYNEMPKTLLCPLLPESRDLRSIPKQQWLFDMTFSEVIGKLDPES